ncbi:MAG: GTP-binding protein [Pirellulales bacterium]
MSDPPRNTDANFESALGALRHAISRFEGCSPDERQALERDLDQLHAMSTKLESGRVEIVVFGEISTGKSALINALIGNAVADVSVEGGWTREVWQLGWQGSGYRVPGFADSEVVLVDTPGLNEVDGSERTVVAREAAGRADLILIVTDSDLNETEYTALVELAASHKPILCVLNKRDLYPPEDLAKLRETLTRRLQGLVEPRDIVTTAADPKPVEYVLETASGATRTEWRRPSPDVEALRVRILEVLQAEGKALVALNAAMYAADKSDRVAALRVRMRQDRANSIIWRYAATKAVAVAVNPVLAFDLIGGSAVDVTMVVTLARVYGIQLNTKGARELITSILEAAGWVMLGEAVVSISASIFKGLTLGYGTVLTALPQGAAAGYGSYIVGQAARYYFEHGASWGREAPKTVVTRILDATDKESVLKRLKDEIKTRIRVNPYAGKS